MTDLYIATPTRADYDALMRLAEAAGYKWCSGSKPTEEHKFVRYECETVVRMRENMLLEYCDKPYYEDNQGVKIETIPNLAKIKAIWKVSRENRDVFTMKHRLPPHYKSARNLYVICDEYSGTYTTKENEIYEALAVEYKPKESEKVMSEKVKLPKFMCEWLDEITSPRAGLLVRPDQYPLMSVWDIYRLKREVSGAVGDWLDKPGNQWKLIDALRYGYEAETEPRWGIKAGNCYMTNPDNYGFDDVTPETAIENDAYWAIKSYADDIVKTLGFGEVVDLNKEVEG